MRSLFVLIPLCFLFIGSSAEAQSSFVIGGDTTVVLDTQTLSDAASLDLSSVGDGVGNPSPDTAVFGINARDAASLPTTFQYTPTDLAPFSGSIEHTGSIFFNNDTVEVGNFTIGFDSNRVGGDNSGFFVESTTGVAAILFDVAGPTVDATPTSLVIDADLVVSSEFATFLVDNGLAATNLTGADVGDATVSGISAIPEPSSVAIVSLLGLVCLARRRF